MCYPCEEQCIGDCLLVLARGWVLLVVLLDKTVPSVSIGEYHNRNARYSPTWSFRWENRGRVAGEDTSVVWLSDGVNSHHDGMDSKLEMTRESDDRGSLDGFQGRSWPESPLFDGSVGLATTSGSDQPITRVVSMDPASHQVPGSMTRDSKLLSSPSAAAERFPIPSWSNESKQGSLCGISDGWSVNALTGFVSSSPWGGSSLDGEAMEFDF